MMAEEPEAQKTFFFSVPLRLMLCLNIC